MQPYNNLRILCTGMGWPSAQPGGLNTYFKHICESLANRHELEALVCVSSKPEVVGPLRVTNVASPDWKLSTRRDAFRMHAAEWMDQQRVDVVYAHFAPYSIGVAKEAKARNIPVVMTFHGPWSEEIRLEGKGLKHRFKTMVAKSWEMKAYRLADAFIVLSETFRDILHRQYGVPLSKIHIIPGGANVSRFKPAADRSSIREKLQLPEGKTMVLTLRRLVNRMGLIQLLEAWREVASAMPDAVLFIGGKGPLREELESRIAEYGLQSSVRLLGYVPDNELAEYYQAADLFVVPSQALEGFGLITVEAMAAGVPVMATPIGGNREILEKFRPDMLFAGKDSGDIASGLLRILKHPERWPGSEQCRSHVLEHYTWERVSQQVNEVFHSVIDLHPHASGGKQSVEAMRKGGREQDEGSLSGSYR
ncbi:glycosyltransferase family 4 protein [Paenibacillus sp. GCM10023248]|uniref:glycosyltransferase family 4 protein n=1 Tax=unclassified Paenibacillus TaxID=185978 RepID=UPI002379AC48|nr:glycosyltransferase family 4 protein [Paenibacillus sp. MAHUQ-63]MDD9267243.1 glycosyltransferase family 4 protein [Paenibacillus sp. MAHUQ-63]